jgi:peptidoglycan/LPS O-acetylase OafA/YrhL
MSQAEGQAPARGTVASLDILRLIAALLVVVYHYFFLAWSEAPGGGGIRDVIPNGPTYPWAVSAVSAGWVGVEVFFVISGFVITMSAQGKTAGDFLTGRFLRLFPGILIFATCAYAVIVSAGVLPIGLATERYLRTLVLFPKGPWIDGVIWTLVAEAVFYFLIWLVLALDKVRDIYWWARVAMLVQAAIWMTVPASEMFTDRIAELASTYLARVTLVSTGSFFLLGIFLFELWSRGPRAERIVMTAAAAICSLISLYYISRNSVPVRDYGQSVATPMAIWSFCILASGLCVLAERASPLGAGAKTFIRQVGMMTYPLYLIHQITGARLLAILYATALQPLIAVMVTILACLAGSWLFARYLEPVIRDILLVTLELPARWSRRRRIEG